MRVEDGYDVSDNPYHNSAHAADVLRSVHVMAVRGDVVRTAGSGDLGLLAVYLAAIVHDFQHKGVNNDFLVRVNDPLAVRGTVARHRVALYSKACVTHVTSDRDTPAARLRGGSPGHTCTS
jgi:hypothetical protein